MYKYISLLQLINISIVTFGVGHDINYSNQTQKECNPPIIISRFPNKPTIINPLPKEAYEHTYNLFINDFSSADTEFIMFLQNRYKQTKHQENMEKEDQLITTFMKNYRSNEKTLNPKTLPMCAFAAAIETLFFHQLIADTRCYPQDYLLTPFEQKYDFKLYPAKMKDFIDIKNSLPPAQLALYKQTIIKELAKKLLITFLRK